MNEADAVGSSNQRNKSKLRQLTGDNLLASGVRNFVRAKLVSITGGSGVSATTPSLTKASHHSP